MCVDGIIFPGEAVTIDEDAQDASDWIDRRRTLGRGGCCIHICIHTYMYIYNYIYTTCISTKSHRPRTKSIGGNPGFFVPRTTRRRRLQNRIKRPSGLNSVASVPWIQACSSGTEVNPWSRSLHEVLRGSGWRCFFGKLLTYQQANHDSCTKHRISQRMK